MLSPNVGVEHEAVWPVVIENRSRSVNGVIGWCRRSHNISIRVRICWPARKTKQRKQANNQKSD